MTVNSKGGNGKAYALTDSDFRDQAEFRAALRRFLRFSEDQARANGITPQQHLLLLAVRGHAEYPNVSIGAVAEALQIRHHSASLLVDRCVRRKLLDRREDPDDRRRALVSLTDEGQKILNAITVANRRQLQSLRGAFFRDSLWQALIEYESSSSMSERTLSPLPAGPAFQASQSSART